MEPAEFEKQYTGLLNDQQKEAVYAVNGPVLLLATPGSGKTSVLVTRLGYMVLCRGIDPRSILTMTYTVAATKDMKNRYAALFGDETAEDLEFRTINGVSKKIIDYFGRVHAGREPFRLATEDGELDRIVRDICQTVNKSYPEDSDVREIRRLITYIKNMMLTEAEIRETESNIDNLHEIYRQYRRILRDRHLMDFDDQMAYAYHILQHYPKVLDHFQEQYIYLCVDEAQDTSKIQHAIIRLLASRHENLFLVGDEDQSIYGFRAAYPDALLSFEKNHPHARVLLMEENYRSTPEIIEAANRFVAENRFRHRKSMIPTRESGAPVHVVRTKSRALQYEYLVNMAMNCSRETAVLFRNNDTALPLIDRLEKNRVSYNCRNIDELFFTHRVVADILDILRFSSEPRDTDLFLRLYYKFGAAVSKNAANSAVEKSRTAKGSLFELLVRAPGVRGTVQDAVIDLAENLPKLKTDNAEAALYRIWNHMHYGKYVEQKKLDTGKYFILEMLAKGVDGPDRFLEKLQALQMTIAEHRNTKDSRIILSTIHSSKGLEYDTVYMADVIDGILPSVTRAEAETDDEVRAYEEERRLYYVGLTRAKNDLYLFQCGEPSSFTSEVLRALPVPAADESDILAPLLRPQIGRHYTDREWGRGEVVAECMEKKLLAFPGGHYELLSYDEMLSRRSIRAAASPDRRSPDREHEAGGADAPFQSPSQLCIGTAVRHRKLGSGRICAVNEKEDFLIINFDKKGDKKIGLAMSLKKQLLMPDPSR